MAHLSSRALASVKADSSYFLRAMQAWQDLYHVKDNPDGYISLAVAENKISADMVAEKMSSLTSIPVSHLSYTLPQGSHEVRRVVASFFQRYITKTPVVDPAHVALVNGGGSVINLLGTHLADPGEYIILCGPGYKGLEGQLATHAQVKISIANLDKDGHGQGVFPPVFCIDALQRAWDHIHSQQPHTDVDDGNNNNKPNVVRAVLICSPNNPTGEVLPRDTVLDIVKWARSKGIHAIFDELYALSVFNDNTEHTSVANALGGNMGDDVHIVWSLSKDLCASGVRFGVLYTQNEKLMHATGAMYAVLLSTSRLVEWTLLHLLSDFEWLDHFFAENKRRLLQTYEKTTKALTDMNIPYSPASAGFFVLADFRQFLTAPTFEAEMCLWDKMWDCKLLLTPGGECFSSQFGFFRICYAAVDYETLDVGLSKLRQCLDEVSIQTK